MNLGIDSIDVDLCLPPTDWLRALRKENQNAVTRKAQITLHDIGNNDSMLTMKYRGLDMTIARGIHDEI